MILAVTCSFAAVPMQTVLKVVVAGQAPLSNLDELTLLRWMPSSEANGLPRGKPERMLYRDNFICNQQYGQDAAFISDHDMCTGAFSCCPFSPRFICHCSCGSACSLSISPSMRSGWAGG